MVWVARIYLAEAGVHFVFIFLRIPPLLNYLLLDSGFKYFKNISVIFPLSTMFFQASI